MNKLKILLSILVGLSVISCKREQTPLLPVPMSDTKSSMPNFSKKANQLLNSDTVIDFDASKSIIRADKPITESEYIKMRVATYRFYRHVKLIDGKYVYQGKGGAKALNLSERVFSAFTNNLDQLNKSFSNDLARGTKVELPEVTDEYLNSLLK